MVAAMNAPLTVFPIDAVETEKTDKTYLVGNDEFLQSVFATDLQACRPIVVNQCDAFIFAVHMFSFDVL
jgi:hypothetical protein